MAKPFVDRDRMAAGGGSYGGYLASDAARARASVQDAGRARGGVQQYTQIARRLRRGEAALRVTTGRSRRSSRAYSPHTIAANFKTPTLVIHGQMDMRVPVNHGIELFNTLQSKGVPSKLVYFPDENHWVLKPQNSLFWYQHRARVARAVRAAGRTIERRWPSAREPRE